MYHLNVIFFPSYFAKSHWRNTQQTEGALGETRVCTFRFFFFLPCELFYAHVCFFLLDFN